MLLTFSLALIRSQFREVPLAWFARTTEAPRITDIAMSQDGRTVSVWTRRSETAANCQEWMLVVDGKQVEGQGDVPCPAAAPRGKRHLFLESKALGDPKALVPVLDPRRDLVALILPHALGVAAEETGALVGAWSVGDFTLRGVSVGEREWLLWLQTEKGVDRLVFVDPMALAGAELEQPLVEAVPSASMPQFGWKKMMPSRQVGPCTLERRGVFADHTGLLLDWRSTSPRLQVRATSTNGEQKVWRVDIAGGTPVGGLQVDRVHFVRHGLWRLLIRFPFRVAQMMVTEADRTAPRMSPVVKPLTLGGSATCAVDENGTLRPTELTLDPRWR